MTMSFIYDDKNLLNSLLEAGEKSIKKKAQQLTPDQLAAMALAKKMAQQLVRQMDPRAAPPATAPIGTESGNPVSFDRQNLETLGDFLKWASDNGVTWNGKRVAYVYPDANQRGPEGYWKFRTYTIDRARDPYDRTAVEVPAYADKDSLVQLITYLRDSNEAKTERVLAVMLGRLIYQTNQFLEKDEQIDPRAPVQPAADTFDPNTMVDGFPDTTVNIRDVYAGIREYLAAADPDRVVRVPLRWKDVSSKAGLIDWMSGMKIIGGDNKPVVPTDPDSDPCGMIHLLYLRAKYLSQYATDRLRPGLTKIEQAYLKQITTLGAQFDYKGQACKVTEPGTVQPTGPATQQPGQAGQISQEALMQLASLKPFDSRMIKPQEIKIFMDRYKQLAQRGDITDLANQVDVAIADIQRAAGTTAPVDLVNLTTTSLRSLTRDPLGLINALIDIIRAGGAAYLDFYTQFKNILGDAAARPIAQQLAPKENNMGQLVTLKGRIMREPVGGR